MRKMNTNSFTCVEWLLILWWRQHISDSKQGSDYIGIFTARNEVGQGYVFTRICDSVHGEGGYPSIHCRWYPSMHCSRSPGGGLVFQHALQVSRPTPRGEVEGSGLGGLQAHTQEGSWGVGGLQAHTWGGVSRPTPTMHWGRSTHSNCCGRHTSYWSAFFLFL